MERAIEVLAIGHLECAVVNAVRSFDVVRLAGFHLAGVDLAFASEAHLVQEVERTQEPGFISVYFDSKRQFTVGTTLSPLRRISRATLSDMHGVVCVWVF